MKPAQKRITSNSRKQSAQLIGSYRASNLCNAKDYKFTV